MEKLFEETGSETSEKYTIQLTPDGFCAPDCSVSRTMPDSTDFETRAETAYVIRVGPSVTLGRFLTQGLPCLWSWRGDNGDGVIAGGIPTADQVAILHRAGLLNNGYVVIQKLTKFDLILSYPETPDYYISADSRVIQLMDRLRGQVQGMNRVAVICDPADKVLTIRNWSSLTVTLLERWIIPLDLSAISFSDLAGTLASAELLIIANPSQAGLASLCSPGAQVVEILPEGLFRTTLQALCAAASLKWAPVFGQVPVDTLPGEASLKSVSVPSFDVPISTLKETLSSLGF